MNTYISLGVSLIPHIVADTLQFVEEIQQVSCKAQGQPLSDRLYLRPINPQGKNNSGSETKINYYQGSNIIIGLWDLRPNMGEFGTLRAYPY